MENIMSKEELSDIVCRAIDDSISSKDLESMSPYEKKLLTARKTVKELINKYYDGGTTNDE